MKAYGRIFSVFVMLFTFCVVASAQTTHISVDGRVNGTNDFGISSPNYGVGFSGAYRTYTDSRFGVAGEINYDRTRLEGFDVGRTYSGEVEGRVYFSDGTFFVGGGVKGTNFDTDSDSVTHFQPQVSGGISLEDVLVARATYRFKNKDLFNEQSLGGNVDLFIPLTRSNRFFIKPSVGVERFWRDGFNDGWRGTAKVGVGIRF